MIGVRMPQLAKALSHIKEGDRVTMKTEVNEIILVRARRSTFRPLKSEYTSVVTRPDKPQTVQNAASGNHREW